MRDVKLKRFAMSGFLSAVMTLCVVLVIAPCQAQQGGTPSASARQPRPFQAGAPHPVSLPHLYWHFLVYQHVLDTKAEQLKAQGRDGSWLRNDLQTRMGFSDADYASIRESSVRLSSELKALDAQSATIRASGVSPATAAKLKALVSQREAYIAAEVTFLRYSLPPARIAAFEAFISQFLAPKRMAVQITPSSGQAAPAGAKP
jgi:hypothetical protein